MWHARTYPMPPAPFSSWLVWLSPQPMHAPCVTRHGTHNTTITCGDPVSHLRPNSLLAYWTSNANPAGGFRLPAVGARAAPLRQRVRGHPASDALDQHGHSPDERPPA